MLTCSHYLCSVALVEHLLTKQGRDVLVAVVPLLATDAAGQTRVPDPDLDNLDVDKLHCFGTAARVHQLARSAQVCHTPLHKPPNPRTQVLDKAPRHPCPQVPGCVAGMARGVQSACML
jgi:hypothetical protein